MFLNAKNRNKIYIIFMLCFVFYNCKTVSNNSESSDILVDIYVGANNGYWKNGEWIGFPFYKNGLNIYTFLVSGKDKYAGGYLPTSPIDVVENPGYRKACILKNGKRIPMTYLCDYKESYIRSIAIYNNDIYAGGYGKTCSGLARAGYWKNGKWIGLNPINNKKSSIISSITVYNGDVYAAGSCYIDSEIRSAGYWKNGKWTTLSFPDDSVNNSGVAEMVIYNGDIYVAGYCDYGSKISIPGYWKNGKWVKLDDTGKIVTSLFIDEKDIYVGGFIDTGLTTSVAGYWKNSKWIELKTPYQEESSGISSIVVHNKNVYAAGWYRNNSSVTQLCYWKNGEVITLYDKAGIFSRNSWVTSIIVVDKAQDED